MALADPELPPGIALPELRVEPPSGLDADCYRRMRDTFYGLPRRSRVVVVLRLALPGRQPLTLDATGRLFGIGPERVRQLENHAVWMLLRALRPSCSPSRSTRDARRSPSCATSTSGSSATEARAAAASARTPATSTAA